MNKSIQPNDPAAQNPLRERAEKMLRTTVADIADMPPEKVQELVHELQVHQTELEIQNEELRNTQVQLAHSLDRYSDLYEFAPVGYLTLDKQGLIMEANLTSAAMLGVERNRLPGRKFSDFVHVASQDAWHLHRRAIFSNRATVGCELNMVTAGG